MNDERTINERVPGMTILGATPFFPPDADPKACFHIAATPEILKGLGQAILAALASENDVGDAEVDVGDGTCTLRVATHEGVHKTTDPGATVYILTSYDV